MLWLCLLVLCLCVVVVVVDDDDDVAIVSGSMCVCKRLLFVYLFVSCLHCVVLYGLHQLPKVV